MSDQEQVLWLILEQRRQGRLCFQKVLNCGCKQDENFDRIVLQTPAREHTLCFSTQLPCCAYIVTDVFNVQEMINYGKIDFSYRMGNPLSTRRGAAAGANAPPPIPPPPAVASSSGLPAVEARGVPNGGHLRDGEPSTSQV